MFMNKKIQYCQDITSSQLHLQIQCNSKQNTSKTFSGYWQTDFKAYMGRQKTQNFHLNDEGEKQSWRTDKTQLQNLFVSIIICL